MRQYVAAGLANECLITEAPLGHEPLSSVGPEGVHIVAAEDTSGRILCYLALHPLGRLPAQTTLRTVERPLLKVERVFGWGIFNRLTLLPDLPPDQIRELGRFVKDLGLNRMAIGALRGPLEVGVALHRLVVNDPLRAEVSGVVGSAEPHGAIRNLDFFHIPAVVLQGVVAHAPEESYLFPLYQHREHYPFATAVSDARRSLRRLSDIERALALPDEALFEAVFALRRTRSVAASSFLPPSGLPRLTSAPVISTTMPMKTRRELLARGLPLRLIPAFSSLTTPEATVLATLLTRQELAAGEILASPATYTGDLLIIMSGQAEVRAGYGSGQMRTVEKLEPGHTFGEAGLLLNDSLRETVVATTRVTFLRLDRETYGRYLRDFKDIELALTRRAAERASSRLSKRSGAQQY
jgi:hypothetical protein